MNTGQAGAGAPGRPAPAPEPDGANRPAVGALMVVGAACLWGSLGLFGRLAFDHGASPLQVGSVRAALAFLGVLPLALARPRRLRLRTAHAPLVLGYGAIGVGFFYYIYMVAIDRLPLAVAAALLYTAPAFVVALAWSLRWEPVRLRRLAPLAMVLAGAFLVTGAFRTLTDVDVGGVAAGVASGVAYALYTVLGKRIRHHYDILTTILYAYGIGAVVLAMVEPPWTVVAEHPDALPILLLMGFGPTLLAALLFYAGIRRIDASTASMLATIEPVVAALIGLTWLSEGLPWSTVAGTALILAAAVMLRPVRDPQPAVASDPP
ncbi:MAG: DMT family transporter [Gemmatimonadota bacterium]